MGSEKARCATRLRLREKFTVGNRVLHGPGGLRAGPCLNFDDRKRARPGRAANCRPAQASIIEI